MRKTINLKLTDSQVERLRERAEALRTTPADLAATFVEEALRARKYPRIDFLDSGIGRLAYVKGTSLKVFMLVHMLRDSFNNDPQALADHLDRDLWMIEAAIQYAQAYPEEIEPLVEGQRTMTFEKLKEILPNIKMFGVH